MNILEVKNLSTYYSLLTGTVKAVENVTFMLDKGEIMGLAGESGCGKTTVALSLLRLIPFPGKIVSGEVLFNGENILEMREEDFRREMRWKKMSLIFQRAMQSLNPVFRIGDQIVEAIKTCGVTASPSEARSRAEQLLELVGIQPSRASNYPHEYSGGMRERAMIAMALACNPEFVIADEPTTGLDVIVQAQILGLIRQLQQKLMLSMILISHDLSVIAEVCSTCAIMYAGRLVEYSDIHSIFKNPAHPYTQGLLEAFPDIQAEKTRLTHISGSPPTLITPPTGCRFHPRCQHASESCKQESSEIPREDRMRTSKKFLETPALFILLSFLIGLVNFADTALRLFHLYINPGGYPLGFALKPLFFFLQAFCLIGYLAKMGETSKNIDKPVFQGLLKTHIAFSAITIILFLLTATIDLGKTGRIVWLICYVTSLTGTCFWFSAKLAGFSRFRLFSVIFLLIGSVFFLWFVNEIYLLLQTLFGLYLPPIVDRFTLWAPAVLMGITLFYTWIILLIIKRKILSRTSIIKYSVVSISAIIPAIWDSYKDGLLNVIIMAIISWGLKYSGYKWFYVSLYFAIFSVYIFLIKQLIEQLDQTVASYLILLGVVSLPWNGLMVFDQGFSSIPGNLLSINALITGFYLRKTLKEQDK